MRLLVCGGRRFSDLAMLTRCLDALPRPTVIITGGASGADFLAEQLAASRRIPTLVYPAEWSRWGRDAGPIRNALMLDEAKPTHALAMPGGPGTADMLRRLHWAGVPVTLGT